MVTVVKLLVGLVAFLHVFFFVLEAVLWTKPYGRKTFRLSADQAEQTKVLAMNQGVYNLFLAAGLIWSLLIAAPWAGSVMVFFLACVVVAGVVGGVTSNPRIFLIQGVPALVALILVHLV